eukprot:COSAG01_NODE_40909_length_458_cov_0.852368_1_plen_72_part_10
MLLSRRQVGDVFWVWVAARHWSYPPLLLAPAVVACAIDALDCADGSPSWLGWCCARTGEHSSEDAANFSVSF